jgi:hypothetical protein
MSQVQARKGICRAFRDSSSQSPYPIGAVRRWAQVTLTQMRKQIDSAKMEDDEQEAQWNA